MLKILIVCLLLVTIVKASCPEGSYQWQTNCFFFQNESTGFADAESNCVATFGGHLTSIHDGFTNALLAQKGQIYLHESTVTDFWIGLTNLVSPGNWTWMDGTDLDFTNWASGEPQNATTNCATLSLADGHWKSDDCFKTKPYVCRVYKSVYETTTTTNVASTTTPIAYPGFVNCTDPFIFFEPTHSCYGSLAWGFTDWTHAEQLCQSKGGHSASIHSYEEFRFIKSFAYVAVKYIWTGAFSNDGGRTWKWSDETPWDYNPWTAGYPNANVSACGLFSYSGLFNDACTDYQAVLCKFPLK